MPHHEITAPTGARMRRARELTGMSERAAARALRVRRTQLRAWERGELVPDADDMAAVINLYSVDLARVWPDRQPLLSPEEPGVLIVGDERIELDDVAVPTAGGGITIDNRSVLTTYLTAVRRQRGLGPNEQVELRAADLSALAGVLDLDDAGLESLLAELLQLTPAGARWAARAMVVGGLTALATVFSLGTAWLDQPSTAEVTALPIAAVAPVEAVPASDLSNDARVLFAPAPVDPDAPVEAEVVSNGSESPFSVAPGAVPVELAPAMFAVAPATDWTPVDTSPIEEPEALRD